MPEQDIRPGKIKRDDRGVKIADDVSQRAAAATGDAPSEAGAIIAVSGAVLSKYRLKQTPVQGGSSNAGFKNDGWGALAHLLYVDPAVGNGDEASGRGEFASVNGGTDSLDNSQRSEGCGSGNNESSKGHEVSAMNITFISRSGKPRHVYPSPDE